MKQALDNEDERIERALKEKEEKYIQEEKEKEAKLKKMLHEQALHRAKQASPALPGRVYLLKLWEVDYHLWLI